MSASDNLVNLEIDGSIAILRLNRPEQRNALSLQLVQQLSTLVSQLDTDPVVRCVTLTGSEQFFCVGGDIRDFHEAGANLPALLKQITGHLHVAMSRLARMEKPLVVAVNGPAAGAGLGLAALGDIVLASDAAHFSMGYTAIGLTPDGGTTSILPRLIGLRRTQELALTNRRVSAAEAVEIGLVTRMVAHDALQADARSVAHSLANGPTGAFGSLRRLLLSAPDNGLEAQMELEARAISDCAAAADGREGIAAFMGKRKPEFLGR